MITQLLLHCGEIVAADELAAAFALPGITDLIIGSVFLGWLGLATAAGGTADIVLLGEVARAQGAELGQLALDLRDPAFNGAFGIEPHIKQFSALTGGSRASACTDS